MNPFERDLEKENEKGQQPSSPTDFRSFRLQPRKDGEIADNRLFFSQFRPSTFKHLGQWPEESITWYLKFFVHFVPVVDEESGRTIKKMVLCEPSMNKYARERLTSPQMVFPEPFPQITTCEFCEEAQRHWDDFTEKKAAAGIEGVSIDEYKRLMDAHPDIQRVRETARDWSADERVYFSVLDYEKLTNGKVGETVRLQALWASKKILAGLWKEYKGGFRFFEPQGSTPIVNVECNTMNGKRRTTYDVRTINEPGKFDDVALEYLLRMDDSPDPFDYVEIWTAGQKLAYIQQGGAPTPESREEEEQEAPAPLEPPKPVVMPKVAPKPPVTAETTPSPSTSGNAAPKRSKVVLDDTLMRKFGP